MPSISHENGRYDEPDPSPTLGRYWDEIVQEMPADPGDLDPSITATVRHLHTRDDAPGASTTFANRLWANLEDQMTTLPAPPLTIPPSRVLPLSTRNPRRHPAPDLQASALRRATWRPMRSATSYAVTVALVVAVIAVYLTFGQSRLFQAPPEAPTSLAAVQELSATPPASAALDIKIDLDEGEVPVESLDGRLASYALPPGTTSTWSSDCCIGARITVVLSGEYAVQSAGPAHVLRHGGAGQWEPVAASTALTLAAGDAVLTRMEADFEASNAGDDPVELLDGQLFTGFVNADPVPTGWIWHSIDTGVKPFTTPEAPMTLRLTEVELAGGDTLFPPPGAILQLAFSPDERATIGTVDDFTRRNVGKSPATLYVLTLTPIDEATPAANP